MCTWEMPPEVDFAVHMVCGQRRSAVLRRYVYTETAARSRFCCTHGIWAAAGRGVAGVCVHENCHQRPIPLYTWYMGSGETGCCRGMCTRKPPPEAVFAVHMVYGQRRDGVLRRYVYMKIATRGRYRCTHGIWAAAGWGVAEVCVHGKCHQRPILLHTWHVDSGVAGCRGGMCT